MKRLSLVFDISHNSRYNILFGFQASLVGHMDKLHLLKPSTIFMEFGAGRGKGVNNCKLVCGLK